jgi:hypothetical protein
MHCLTGGFPDGDSVNDRGMHEEEQCSFGAIFL